MPVPSRTRVADWLPLQRESALPLAADLPTRLLRIVLAIFVALAIAPSAASAQVLLSFHSFNGSLLGRYPHAFIVLEGTLDEDGRAVHENYGYTSVSVTPAILAGNVKGTIHVEKDAYLRTTNRHFTVPISDAQYRAIVSEVHSWRDAGKVYNLKTRNCIHFVARIALMIGLRAEVPATLTRRPKEVLNLIARLNPQLGAREIP